MIRIPLILFSLLLLGIVVHILATKGFYGTALYRKDGILPIEPIRNITDVSLVECLLICRDNTDCKAFNYGQRNCMLLDSTLCDTVNIHLRETTGYNYYDLVENPTIERESRTWGQYQCWKLGKCAKHCLPKFIVHRDSQSWQKALELCHNKKCSQLAMPRTLEENEQLRDILLREKGNYWIGVTDTEVQGSYRYYADLTPINPQFKSVWAPGQPNNLSSENCVMLKEESEMKWHDANCNTASNFVCQCY